MINEKLRNSLFNIIRAGMGLESTQVDLSREDFSQLKKMGATQAILPILWVGMKKLGIEPTWLQELSPGQNADFYRYMVRDSSLQLICEALDSSEIPYIPLKGSVLQALYPEPWMRTSSDIDILIHEEDLSGAVAVIEEKAGFIAKKRNYHDVTMVSDRFCLELHFSIKEHMPNIDQLLSQAWDYASPAGQGTRFVFTPEFQLFHVLSHMSYHMVNGGLGIRPFLDLWLLRTKTEYDEAVLKQMCDSCGILRFYDVSCELLDVWMYGASHSATTARLEEYCLDGSVFGSSKNGAAQREHRGLSFLLHRLFVSREVLEGMYPPLRTKPYLMPYYQFKRWLRLADPRKRKNVIGEIRLINTTQAGAIDAFDQLLVSAQ